MEEIKGLLEDVLSEYSNNSHLDQILEAKKEYFDLTGKFSEEDEDYENRMNGFNYWYLLQRRDDNGETLFNLYAKNQNLDEQRTSPIENINHSLFEYLGLNFTKKKHVFKDLLHDNKVTIHKDKFNLSFVKNDIFVARSIDHDNEFFLLDDISILPQEVKPLLVKECKKVRKLKDKSRDLEFLMTIEKLKTKWRRYGHLDARKIFNFSL